MAKTIFCKIGQRCKSITFKNEDNESDCDAVRRSLIAACTKDKLLKAMMLNKYIVLQRNHPRRSDLLCDIEDDEEIKDDEIIHVVLIHIDVPNNSIQPESLIRFEEPPGETNSFMELKKLMATHTALQEDKERNSSDGSYLPDLGGRLSANSTTVSDNIDQRVNHTDKERPPSKYIKHQPREFSPDLPTNKSPGVPFPFVLPKFSERLLAIYNQGKLLENLKDFISFWACNLENITNNAPTRGDYQNYSRSIVSTFPELGGGNHGYTLISKKLSTCIRNRRSQLRKKLAGFDNKKENRADQSFESNKMAEMFEDMDCTVFENYIETPEMTVKEEPM